MRVIILSISSELYSTDRLAVEVEDSGHEVEIVNHLKCDIRFKDGKVGVFYQGRNIVDEPSLIIPRIGASATKHGALVVRQFELNGIPTTATAKGIIDAQNKAHSIQKFFLKYLPVPDTVLSVDVDEVDSQVESLGGVPIVIKLHEGTQGTGVMIASCKKSAKSIVETMVSLDKQILMQEFIRESNGEDIRVIVAGNKVIAAMKRKGSASDFRSNIHKGGSGEKVKLSEKEKMIAVRSVSLLGLSIAGVDIIRSNKGPLLLEVNSTPGLQGIEECTDINVASKLVNYAIHMATIVHKKRKS